MLWFSLLIIAINNNHAAVVVNHSYFMQISFYCDLNRFRLRMNGYLKSLVIIQITF